MRRQSPKKSTVRHRKCIVDVCSTVIELDPPGYRKRYCEPCRLARQRRLALANHYAKKNGTFVESEDVKCEHCKAVFTRSKYQRGKRYCTDCANKHLYLSVFLGKSCKLIYVNCDVCLRLFTFRGRSAKRCSEECSAGAKRRYQRERQKMLTETGTKRKRQSLVIDLF